MTGQTLLQAGSVPSPPSVLVTLVVVAIVLFVGRVLLHLAWRFVLLAIVVVTGLWLLDALGSGLTAV